VVDFAPRDLLAQLSRLFGPRASSQGLAFELRCEARVPAMLKGDPLRLSQVLTNLVMNALKFTAKGRVEVVLDWAVDLLMARVSDTGIGMNPEQVGRVFSAFEQADASMTRRFGGSGLGLAIVKRLCELQGGCITVTSEPGVGSVFTATLAMPEGAGLPVVAPAAPRPSVEGMRVLVAEDNVINQRVAERLLEKLGVSVTIAVNGLEALRAVERGDWTVVLMDLQMPEMDGLEATRRIRELPRAQPVIIAVTANALNEHRTAALEAGVDDFLTKPITLDALASALGRARGGRVSLSA
jgi:CheY-like chemotaxis protein